MRCQREAHGSKRQDGRETMNKQLIEFIRESNQIESIRRDPLSQEIKAHTRLLDLGGLVAGDLEVFVSDAQPGAIFAGIRASHTSGD